MKLSPERPPEPRFAENEEDPGVPLFRTWRGVYAFVLGCFIVVIVLLTIFSRTHA